LDWSGFLHDPESENAHYYYIDYKPQQLSQLASLPIAILLGEPGIGKSTSLNDEYLRLQANNEACLYRKLNEYHSDIRLISDIFESEDLRSWQLADYHLTLLLDSLDECSLSIPSVARILVSQLRGLPTHRLSLRLTCRTADWPSHLIDELNKLWGLKEDSTTQTCVFELAPLRRADILSAATDYGFNGEAFIKEVKLKEIQPLASHPNTLNMLLSLFGKPGGLPKQRSELYRLGCQTLANEHNTFRKKELRQNCKLNANQRMAVAARIAAQMIFGQRSSIWRGDKDWDVESADLLETDVLGGIEHANGQDFAIDIDTFQETIECSLFSGRGENRIGFAHQSYVEFLAAWYLYSRGLDYHRILSLLQHPDDKRVPPQHTETAIWLAALHEEVFTALVESEPLLLIRTDLSDTNDKQKIQLAETLLNTFNNKTEFDRDWGLREHYRKLAHPALTPILQRYINDQNLTISSRNAAMEIAAACDIKSLADDIISVALNPLEDHYLRSNAAESAIILANDSQLHRLRPIVLHEAGIDPDDRLKSAVVPSLWPTHISTKELFGLLLHSNSARCLGKFRYSPKELIDQFSTDDLLIAMQWILAAGKTHHAFEADRLKDAIMLKAWEKLDSSYLLTGFANTVWGCIQRHERIFNRRGDRVNNPFNQDEEKRHAVIMELLRLHYVNANNINSLNSLFFSQDSIIRIQDNLWLLERYKDANNPELREILAKCIETLLRWENSISWIEDIIEAANENTDSPLALVVTRWQEPIWLDSEYAQQLKEQHYQAVEWRQQGPTLLDPVPAVRVEEALLKFVAGATNTWMQLWQELNLPDDATDYSWSYDNIISSPGWQRLSLEQHSITLTCAEVWLTNQVITDDDIFQPDNSISHQHISTYLALRLLLDLNSATLENTTEEIWGQWAKALVVYPFEDDHEKRISLIKLAYRKNQKVVVETYRRVINKDISSSLPPYKAKELAEIWDANIAMLLNEFLAYPNLTHAQISSLLEILLEHGDETAFDFACTLVKESDDDSLARVAAQELITNQTRRSWQLIWSVISTNTPLGEALMLGVANNSRRDTSILSSLTETEIADLYFWLEKHFPVEKDIHHPPGEVRTVTARDEVARLRDSCINQLASLGTQAAVEALSIICERLPHKDWFKYKLNEAKQSLRKNTLQALSPSEIIAYTHSNNGRLARCSAELMDAVLVSLQRLQKKLQGQTPSAPFLWDLTGNGESGTPKSEDRLTDFVKLHLEADLPTFVIDREVQIRNLKEHGIGERTDLKIETKDQNGRSIAVIIESKGCWNKELMTAMQTQLNDRYLKLTNDACGIYLIGWFRCARWKDNKNCNFAGTKEELLTALENQANSLSLNTSKVSAFVLDASY